MIRVLKRRSRPAVARDPAARFAHDLAVQPPTKDVASVKAASDVYEANLRSGERSPDGPTPAGFHRDK